METRKKKILGGLCAFALLSVYACASYANKNTDSYWSSFYAREGARADYSSGFVVVDAVSPGATGEGIGPFKGNGPSFTDADVVLEEDENDRDVKSKDKKPENVYWKEVEINTGDTLSKLSDTYGILIKDIMRANELTDRHRLREGQTLFIPDSADRVLETLAHVRQLKNEEISRRKQAEPVKISLYAIKAGDNLWSVANAFDVDVNTIYGCNTISETDVLKVGTTIRVPNQDGIYIKVRPNQTVDKIAKEYSIFPEAIYSANEMEPDAVLKEGTELFLPGAKVVAFVTSAKGSAAVVRSKASTPRGLGWPVVGKISSRFGWRKDPVRGGRDFHTGLDIRAPYGRAVVAAASGRVVYSGWMGGYGKTIVISHPGKMTTLYAHCSKLLVKTGTDVPRGAKIAQVGSTGRSTGNHVHFEVRRAGSLVNPLNALR